VAAVGPEYDWLSTAANHVWLLWALNTPCIDSLRHHSGGLVGGLGNNRDHVLKRILSRIRLKIPLTTQRITHQLGSDEVSRLVSSIYCFGSH